MLCGRSLRAIDRSGFGDGEGGKCDEEECRGAADIGKSAAKLDMSAGGAV